MTDPKNDQLFLDALVEKKNSARCLLRKVADEGLNFLQNEPSQSSQIYLSPEKLMPYPLDTIQDFCSKLGMKL